jgi:nitrite reductase (NADH) small subunit
MAQSVIVGAVDQIPVGEGRTFIVNSQQIAVFRTHSGEVYATQAQCPHQRGPLADGLLGGTTIYCPLHDRAFDVRSGEALSGECSKLKTYSVVLTDENQMLVTV